MEIEDENSFYLPVQMANTGKIEARSKAGTRHSCVCHVGLSFGTFSYFLESLSKIMTARTPIGSPI